VDVTERLQLLDTGPYRVCLSSLPPDWNNMRTSLLFSATYAFCKYDPMGGRDSANDMRIEVARNSALEKRNEGEQYH